MNTFTDIFSSIQYELSTVNENLKRMVGAKHPILYAAAEHLFYAGGKRIRPALVLLVAYTTSKEKNICAEHYRLAEITEIIHTASLLHDDIVDECDTRRGVTTVHNTFNTKVAILAGDFLFAQSSWYLANLNNLEVVKTISKVITDFAEGEVRQGLTNFDTRISIDDYIEKSFYKTASLLAASCKGAAMLSNCSESEQNDFYIYGKHLGLAFQIIDDILDIIGSHQSLGKPAGSDLLNGNLTSPILFALEENNELNIMINREFRDTTDIQRAIQIIKNTQGIDKAKDLAMEHIQIALGVLKSKPSSSVNYTLELICNYIINRLS